MSDKLKKKQEAKAKSKADKAAKNAVYYANKKLEAEQAKQKFLLDNELKIKELYDQKIKKLLTEELELKNKLKINRQEQLTAEEDIINQLLNEKSIRAENIQQIEINATSQVPLKKIAIKMKSSLGL